MKTQQMYIRLYGGYTYKMGHIVVKAIDTSNVWQSLFFLIYDYANKKIFIVPRIGIRDGESNERVYTNLLELGNPIYKLSSDEIDKNIFKFLVDFKDAWFMQHHHYLNFRLFKDRLGVYIDNLYGTPSGLTEDIETISNIINMIAEKSLDKTKQTDIYTSVRRTISNIFVGNSTLIDLENNAIATNKLVVSMNKEDKKREEYKDEKKKFSFNT